MKLAMISAFALALGISGAAWAAEESQPPAGQPRRQPQNQPGQEGASQKERDHTAELKKCDSAPDKQKCVDGVKKKFGQM